MSCADTLRVNSSEGVRLVRGSHIVTRKLFDHDRCYFFQGEDGRIIFAIPYEPDFTLIGTTDQDHKGKPQDAVCTPEEQDYLCAFASHYFARPVTRGRYRLDLFRRAPALRRRREIGDGGDARLCAAASMPTGAPLLNVFGGKITTYRRLAEGALEKLAPFFPGRPGRGRPASRCRAGISRSMACAALIDGLKRDYPFLDAYWARRLVRAYGTEARDRAGRGAQRPPIWARTSARR